MKREEFLKLLRRYYGLTENVDVRASFERLRDEIESALNQWPGRPADYLSIAFTFSDRVVAYTYSEDQRLAWEIPWSRAEEGFAFGDPLPVEPVLRYEQVESKNGQSSERFTERVEQRLALLPMEESDSATGRRIKAIGITADVVNGNRRRYPRSVLATALEDLNSHLHESAGQGRVILTGEAEHPSDKPTRRPNILETVVKWERAYLQENGQVALEGQILPTSKGKDILVLVEGGVPVDVSQRGYGISELIEESGQTIEEVRELTITGYDLVADGSDPNAQITEGQQSDPKEKKPMTLDELLKLFEKQPELAEALMKKMGLANREELAEALGTDPSKLEDELKAAKAARDELADRKRREAVDKAITEATKELAYGDEINQAFVQAVRDADPAKPEDVVPIVESKRKEYDAIMSKSKLAGMGKPGIDVKGPVFEEETNQPEYTRPSFEFTERLVERGMARRRDLRKLETPNALFTRQYLEAFDKAYKSQLLAEAQAWKQFQEAEQTSDLNLPYSVSRAIIEEAVPELVALSVFDFGMAEASPTRVYFEAYSAESGATAAITDEDVTSDEGAWVALAHKRIQTGTVTVTGDGGSPTYSEYTDYLIDYGEGRLYTLASGSIGDATSLDVDYTYDSVREGELTAIQRGKGSLSYQTIELFADRLATEISDEAIAFASTQLGWDARSRTVGMLIREIREMIDSHIFRLAIAQAHIAANSGGTWTSATDTVAELVEKIGTAKVAVRNDYYMPTAIVMSVTNADRLSNWDGFARDGFPDAVLNAAGYVGRVKGLPVFETTQMPDTKILVANRELVQHRVLSSRPMSLKGPYPSYSSNKLVASEQWYVEEYNRTISLLENKGAYVTVA